MVTTTLKSPFSGMVWRKRNSMLQKHELACSPYAMCPRRRSESELSLMTLLFPKRSGPFLPIVRQVVRFRYAIILLSYCTCFQSITLLCAAPRPPNFDNYYLSFVLTASGLWCHEKWYFPTRNCKIVWFTLCSPIHSTSFLLYATNLISRL